MNIDQYIIRTVSTFTAGFLGMFVHRLASQVLQLQSLLLTILGLGKPPSAGQRAGLVRDEFGLHKMIVVTTSAGKVNWVFLNDLFRNLAAKVCDFYGCKGMFYPFFEHIDYPFFLC
jgi:hypothetical protein